MFRRWYGDVDMDFEGEAEDLDDPNDLEFAFNRMRRQQGIVPFPRFDDEPQTAYEQTPHTKKTPPIAHRTRSHNDDFTEATRDLFGSPFGI